MKKAIKAWTDAYNELNKTYKDFTKYTQVEKGEDASKDNGVLLGDTTSRMIMSELKALSLVLNLHLRLIPLIKWALNLK